MTDTTNLDRLELLVARLERLGIDPASLETPTPLTPARPVLPVNVASGELIESAWGNSVADMFKTTDYIVIGGATGAQIPAQGEGPIVTPLPLGAGCYTVYHQVYCSSTGDMNATTKILIDGVLRSQARVKVGLVTGWTDTEHTIWNHAIVASDVPVTITVTLQNLGGAPVGTYADTTNHMFFAVAGRASNF